MKPNQTMTVNKLDQTYKLTESADYAEQWINCKVFWDEVPMSIISKELERQFDVTFAFALSGLRHSIAGISQKMLIQHLNELIHFGFVVRTTFEGYPLKVEYDLTDRGRKIFE